MAIRSEDFVCLNELDARTRQLVDNAAAGTDQILTDEDGTPRVAVIDMHKLEHYRQLERDAQSPFTVDDLIQGLEDVAAGHVISEEENRKLTDDRLERIRKRVAVAQGKE